MTRRAKPNAGVDQTLPCANPATGTLTTTAIITGFSPVGGTFTALNTNPAPAAIDDLGKVAGMTVAGTYQFVYFSQGCTDTVAVTVQPCPGCVKPDAGKDSTYACTNNQLPTSFDLKDAASGQKWKVGTIPPGSSVSVLTPSGNVSGTFVAGTYQFILQTQSDSLNCRDTLNITLSPCAGCIKPDAGKDSTIRLCEQPIANRL